MIIDYLIYYESSSENSVIKEKSRKDLGRLWDVVEMRLISCKNETSLRPSTEIGTRRTKKSSFETSPRLMFIAWDVE